MDEQFNLQYFDYSGYCRMHRNYQCSACRRDAENERKNSMKNQDIIQGEECKGPGRLTAITTVPLNVDARKACSDAKAVEAFDKQINMIQTVFGYDDEKMASLKVKDLPKLLAKAKDEATVGHMNQLLNPPGFLDKLLCRIK